MSNNQFHDKGLSSLNNRKSFHERLSFSLNDNPRDSKRTSAVDSREKIEKIRHNGKKENLDTYSNIDDVDERYNVISVAPLSGGVSSDHANDTFSKFNDSRRTRRTEENNKAGNGLSASFKVMASSSSNLEAVLKKNQKPDAIPEKLLLNQNKNLTNDIVALSWQKLKESYSIDEMGEELYKAVFVCAPHITSLFKKPTKVLASNFGYMLQSIVILYHSNAEELDKRLDELALKHVDYGADKSHFPFFKSALLYTLDLLLGDDMTEEIEEEWSIMWDYVGSRLETRLEMYKGYIFALRKSWEIITDNLPYEEFNQIILSKLVVKSPELLRNLPRQYVRILRVTHEESKYNLEIEKNESQESVKVIGFLSNSKASNNSSNERKSDNGNIEASPPFVPTLPVKIFQEAPTHTAPPTKFVKIDSHVEYCDTPTGEVETTPRIKTAQSILKDPIPPFLSFPVSPREKVPSPKLSSSSRPLSTPRSDSHHLSSEERPQGDGLSSLIGRKVSAFEFGETSSVDGVSDDIDEGTNGKGGTTTEKVLLDNLLSQSQKASLPSVSQEEKKVNEDSPSYKIDMLSSQHKGLAESDVGNNTTRTNPPPSLHTGDVEEFTLSSPSRISRWFSVVKGWVGLETVNTLSRVSPSSGEEKARGKKLNASLLSKRSHGTSAGGDDDMRSVADDAKSGRSTAKSMSGHGGKFSLKNIPKLSEKLEEILSVLTIPDKFSTRRYDMALEWMRLPVEMKNLEEINGALTLGIVEALDMTNQLENDSVKEAWMWLLQLIHRDTFNLVNQIKVQSFILIDSWALVMKLISLQELGVRFYEMLFTEAPHIQSLFTRPKSQVGSMFTSVVEILIKAVRDPLELATQLRKIAISHIKYNVQPEHIPVFGHVLLETINGVLQESFTLEVRLAWGMLWDRVASKFVAIIQSGTNIITRAMISGLPDNLAKALENTPSENRIYWSCKIDLDGDFLSPLYWAIRDGKLNVAQVLLKDVLTIRRDRSRWFYGREILFEAHPDLVEVLCKDAPTLLNDLLNGLVWTSRHIENNKKRVVYFAKDLWGDPQLSYNQKVHKTPISSLVRLGDVDVFSHPLIDFVVKKKWDSFGVYRFLRSQVVRILLLVCFLIGFGIDGLNHVAVTTLRFVCLGLSLLDVISLLWIVGSQVLKEDYKSIQILKYRLTVPSVMSNKIASGRILFFILYLVAFCLDRQMIYNEDYSSGTSVLVLYSISCIILFVLCLETVVAVPSMAAFLHAIVRMASDLVKFCVVLFILMIAFATAIKITVGPYHTDFRSIPQATLSLLQVTLSLRFIDLDQISEHGIRVWCWVLFLIYVIISVILMLNLLIGQITTSYEFVVKRISGLAKLDRGAVILNVEEAMGIKNRIFYFQQMRFSETVEMDKYERGLTGGVAVLVDHQLNSKETVEDRIIRYPGEVPGHKPFPLINSEKAGITTMEQKLDYIFSNIRSQAASKNREGNMSRIAGHTNRLDSNRGSDYGTKQYSPH